jgi:Tfp pilus assembly protein PilN
MNPVSIIALCSLGVSVLTTIFMLFGQRRTATTDYVAQLETRIEALEKELTAADSRIKSLEEHNGSLMRENIELLRQIARAKQ